MKTVTILGAVGRFGDVATQAFLADGWRVRGVVRGKSIGKLTEGVEPAACDAMDQVALIQACQGSDIIVHGLNPESYDKWEEFVLPLGRNVLAAARATGATVMMPGNVYNYGTSIGMNVDEATPFAPDTSKGDIRVRLEAMFADAQDVRTIIIRAGDFFGGKQDGSWLDLMILKDLAKGKFVWPGPYDVPHAFAYIPDLADAFVKVANKREQLSRFETLHFAGYTLTGNEMKAATEASTGHQLKQGSVPWRLLRAIGIFSPLLKAVAEMSYLWRVPHALNGSKLDALVDLSRTPINEALRNAIDDLNLARK